jgi:hypothetical protein
MPNSWGRHRKEDDCGLFGVFKISMLVVDPSFLSGLVSVSILFTARCDSFSVVNCGCGLVPSRWSHWKGWAGNTFDYFVMYFTRVLLSFRSIWLSNYADKI